MDGVIALKRRVSTLARFWPPKCSCSGPHRLGRLLLFKFRDQITSSSVKGEKSPRGRGVGLLLSAPEWTVQKQDHSWCPPLGRIVPQSIQPTLQFWYFIPRKSGLAHFQHDSWLWSYMYPVSSPHQVEQTALVAGVQVKVIKESIPLLPTYVAVLKKLPLPPCISSSSN